MAVSSRNGISGLGSEIALIRVSKAKCSALLDGMEVTSGLRSSRTKRWSAVRISCKITWVCPMVVRSEGRVDGVGWPPGSACAPKAQADNIPMNTMMFMNWPTARSFCLSINACPPSSRHGRNGLTSGRGKSCARI